MPLSVTAGPKVRVLYPTVAAAVGTVDPLELELPELELLEALVLAPLTTIEKAGSAMVVVPSLAERIIRSFLAVSAAVPLGEGWAVTEWKVTEMMILSYLPAFAAVGLPESPPEVKSKLAQPGLFWIEKLTGSPVGFSTVGVKL